MDVFFWWRYIGQKQRRAVTALLCLRMGTGYPLASRVASLSQVSMDSHDGPSGCFWCIFVEFHSTQAELAKLPYQVQRRNRRGILSTVRSTSGCNGHTRVVRSSFTTSPCLFLPIYPCSAQILFDRQPSPTQSYFEAYNVSYAIVHANNRQIAG